ncbi:hypothetical protein CHUAL_013565 [Chamberlinius hualienensis]
MKLSDNSVYNNLNETDFQSASWSPQYIQPTNDNIQPMDIVINGDEEPMDIAIIILTVFLLSPLIICSNSLLIASFHRYKRLRTPSNCLIVSLAISDLSIGLFLPLQVYIELSNHPVQSAILCLLPYCVIFILCSVSILNMTAIAIDRYMSLSQPLTYNNIITKTSITRFIAVFWIYSLLLSSSPILAYYYTGTSVSIQGKDGVIENSVDTDTIVPLAYSVDQLQTCSFDMVGNYVRLFLFCMLYAPCAVIVLFCYIYVYIVARYHANAIYSVELSVRHLNSTTNLKNPSSTHVKPTSQHNGSAGSGNSSGSSNGHRRYGRTLALTVGLFFLLWLPFQIVMLMDIFRNSSTVLTKTWRIYLAFIALSTSAINPWIYGYRNAEFRSAYQKILNELGTKFGLSRNKTGSSKDLLMVNNSNVRLCVSPNHMTMTSLLIPSTSHHRGADTKDHSSCEHDVTTVVICETTVTVTNEILQQ